MFSNRSIFILVGLETENGKLANLAKVDELFEVNQRLREASPCLHFGIIATRGFASGFEGLIHDVALRLERMKLLALRLRESGEDVGFAKGVGFDGGGLGDLLRRESTVVEAGAVDTAAEAVVAAGLGVTAAEEDLALVGFEGSTRGFAVGAAVGLTIAVAADGAIGLIDDGDMYGTCCGFDLGAAFEEFAAFKEIAAGDPVRGCFFGKDE